MSSTHTFVSGFLDTLVRMNAMKKTEAQASDHAFHESAKENFVDLLFSGSSFSSPKKSGAAAG